MKNLMNQHMLLIMDLQLLICLTNTISMIKCWILWISHACNINSFKINWIAKLKFMKQNRSSLNNLRRIYKTQKIYHRLLNLMNKVYHYVNILIFWKMMDQISRNFSYQILRKFHNYATSTFNLTYTFKIYRN